MSTHAYIPRDPADRTPQLEIAHEQDLTGSFFEPDSQQPLMPDYTSLKAAVGDELHRDLPSARRTIHGAVIVFNCYRAAWLASGRPGDRYQWPDESRVEQLAVVSDYMAKNARRTDVAVINDIVDEKDDNQIQHSEHAALTGLARALKRSFPLNQETTTIRRILALWVSEELDLLPSSYADIKQRVLASHRVAQNKSPKHPWNIA